MTYLLVDGLGLRVGLRTDSFPFLSLTNLSSLTNKKVKTSGHPGVSTVRYRVEEFCAGRWDHDADTVMQEAEGVPYTLLLEGKRSTVHARSRRNIISIIVAAVIGRQKEYRACENQKECCRLPQITSVHNYGQ
jgi:hypothetical protein